MSVSTRAPLHTLQYQRINPYKYCVSVPFNSYWISVQITRQPTVKTHEKKKKEIYSQRKDSLIGHAVNSVAKRKTKEGKERACRTAETAIVGKCLTNNQVVRRKLLFGIITRAKRNDVSVAAFRMHSQNKQTNERTQRANVGTNSPFMRIRKEEN